MNKRRQILLALGAAAIVMPFASFAQQQAKVWRIGFLAYRGRPVSLDADVFGAFPRGMRELGYVEGKNLMIEWRFGEGRAELLPILAAELVQLKADVIVTASTPAIRAVQKVTATIPAVMVGVGDPVEEGLVKSLARPGGNITGLSNLNVDIGPKLLEMLSGMLPKLARAGVLVNSDNSGNALALKNVQAAAQRTGVTILPFDARRPHEVENVFSQIVRQKAGALIVMREGFFIQQARQIAELASKNRLPSIATFREYAEAGGLMSYGANLTDQYRRAATYVDKILKGAKPGELPVEQPTQIEFIINAKTARALGLKIPQSLMISADKVIE
jgi:putative ABC transport system substrate-binding protein